MKKFKKLLVRLFYIVLALAAIKHIAHKQQIALLIHEQKIDTAFDLVLNQKSPRVPNISTGIVARLYATMLEGASPEVRLKDVPPPIGDGTADYHIIYATYKKSFFGLRMKVVGTNHIIIGTFQPADPPPLPVYPHEDLGTNKFKYFPDL